MRVRVVPVAVAVVFGLVGVGSVRAAVPPSVGVATAGAPAVRGGAPAHVEVVASPVRQACPVGSTVVVVGDSITELGSPDLRAGLVAAGFVPQINARGGRTIGEGVEVVWGFGEEVGPRRCWVIGLGTNDISWSNPQGVQSDVARLLGFIPAEPIWWVPVRVPAGDVVNDAVAATRAVLVDGWVPADGDILPDGVHTTVQGRARWAAEVIAALTREVPDLEVHG